MKSLKFTSITTIYLLALLGMNPNGGWTNSTGDTVKEWIEENADALKKGVDKLGDDLSAIQDYLNNYSWKGIVENKATSGPITLKNLELNDYSKSVVVKPGERIEAEVLCILDAGQCSKFDMYRVVIGIKGQGPQALIGNELGLMAGKSREKFSLIAPAEPGMYQILFRPVNTFSKKTAFDSWKDDEGNEPSSKTTIGIIFVK